jgi:hypothetical protein
MGLYHKSSQIHGLNMRRHFDHPQANLTIYLRGHYFGIKLFNHFPLKIKELAYDIKQFRVALNALLHSKFYYTLDDILIRIVFWLAMTLLLGLMVM